MGSSKVDKKISADDIARLLTHFSVSRAIRDSVMEAEPLKRPQRQRLIKAAQMAVEGEILCCGSKQKYRYVEEVDSPKDCDEKLAFNGQDLSGALTLACHVLCRQRK